MRNLRIANQTSIIAGEGKSERIFLTYLKNIYWSKEGKHIVTIHKNIQEGHGGGSSIDVAREVMNQFGARLYGAIVLLLDSDVAQNIKPSDICTKALSKCRYRHVVPKDKVKCIMMSPCFEGFILKILEKKVPGNSSYCKQSFEAILGKKAPKVDLGNYANHCPKSLLEEKRKYIPELNDLIAYFEIANKDDFDKYFR